jgi:sugar-specific transcriptional regulator TrmB
MNLYEALSEAGLNEREAKTYLALLELGESSVLQVGLRSGIERTYSYDILESLVKKGLASALEKNGRRRYLAADPTTLEQHQEKRLLSIRAALPELRAHYNTSDLKPTVKYYEGKTAIGKLYEELVTSEQFDSVASPQALYDSLGKQLNGFGAQIVKSGTRARELITQELGIPDYTKTYRKPLQEVRMLPEKIRISTDTLIYENKVVSIAYTPILHAVVMEGSEIVNTQKTLFEFMWESARVL